MRAVRCREGRVSVVDVAPPEAGVRVRVRSAGICGSDLHMVDGGFPIPHTLGHEMAGELADGTAVAIEPLTPCGHCAACERGEYNFCARGPEMILGVGRDGGMAEEISVPARCLVPLPGSVDVRDACLVEPLAVAAHGLRRIEWSRGSRVAVVGGGTIGLCAVAAAQAGGARVALEARHAAQREAGARLGATACDASEESAFDVVIDAAGSESALERCVALCRPGATLLLLATYWNGLTLPAFGVTTKGLRIEASSMYAQHGVVRDIDAAAVLLAGNPEIAPALITHRLPLDAAPEGFEMAARRDSGAIKVVLEP